MRDHPRAINRICEQVSKQPKFQAHKGKKKKSGVRGAECLQDFSRAEPGISCLDSAGDKEEEQTLIIA